MSKVSRKFLTALILLLAFALFTVILMKVDVESLKVMDATHAPTAVETPVGLAGLNQFVQDQLNDPNRPILFSMDMWYTISKLLAAFSIAFGCCFALAGLIQLIRRKNVFKVNYVILLLGCVYILLGVLYVFFSKYSLNFRPVLEPDGTLETSFPSSHTLLVVTIMLTAIIALPKLVKNRALVALLDVVAVVTMIAMVVARLLSGVHWFTDILGGILFSAAIAAFFSAFVALVGRRIRRKKKLAKLKAARRA